MVFTLLEIITLVIANSRSCIRMNAFAKAKWLIDVPMSFQLPTSFTRKKKFRAITSLKAITMKNVPDSKTPSCLLMIRYQQATSRNGMITFHTNSAVITNGSNIVVKRYVLDISKLLILAIFPVLKKLA